MNRMSRAGRKQVIIHVLQARFKTGKKDAVTVGFIARCMGLKSSTYLKNLLQELENEDDRILSYDFSWGRAYKFKPYEQTTFLERDITINGQLVAVRDFYDKVQSNA